MHAPASCHTATRQHVQHPPNPLPPPLRLSPPPLLPQYWKGITYKDPDVVRTVAFILWGIFNPIRMFSGWYGNSQETLPWLILFCILTLLPLHVTIYYIMLGSYVSVCRRQGAGAPLTQLSSLPPALLPALLPAAAVLPAPTSPP
jgi:hypothetical protein